MSAAVEETTQVALAGAAAAVRAGLLQAAEEAAAQGMPRLAIRGQLIRPMLAYAAVEGGEGRAVPAGFWRGALAVQLAHEASLVHDDIVDGATTRRGEPTVVARRGVAGALVHGDHLLTSAYRLAAQTGSLAFADLFAGALERTVAGEIAQARGIGRAIGWEEYRGIALGKAGELLGCALALAPTLERPARAPEIHAIGRRLGLLYQMLDDLLDYCPRCDTGKPPLGDFAQRRWTWPLAEAPGVDFGDDPARVAERLSAPAPGGSALRRSLRRLEREARELTAGLDAALGESPVLDSMIGAWVARAREAVAAEEAEAASRERRRRAGPSPALLARLPATGGAVDYLARNSRSFRFAARFFPPADLDRVAHVYAFCRVTDDLVDRPAGADPEELLGEWSYFACRAYDGAPSGIALLDRAMRDMAGPGVPFTYADELIEGMRMDLRGERYPTLDALRRYTYRVASVVGLWLTELSGVREPRVLERAASLGHAMQLTNILRDVGEDACHGRIYLPADRMAAHGVTAADLCAMCEPGTPIPAGYATLTEELLRAAEAEYRLAIEAIPELPRGFQRPVAVAAHVYRGIHAEIRRRAYDNLRHRAVTSAGSKALLAARALWELRGAVRPATPMESGRRDGQITIRG